MTAAALQALQQWTASQIHDTVAAIARQPAFAGSARQSLIGRFWRFVMARLRELLVRYQGSASARFVVIASLAIIILVIVARLVTARELDARRRRFGRSGARVSAHEDLWLAAQRAAASGAHAEACHLLYAALLHRMANLDGLRLHPSKTSGDYWRELRRRGSGAGDSFRAFTRRFDRAMYGSTAPDANDVADLLALAERVLSARRAA